MRPSECPYLTFYSPGRHTTISSTLRRAGPFDGNDATTELPFLFKVFAKGDVLVTLIDSAGVESVAVLDSDYAVTLNSDQDTSPGGKILYPIVGSRSLRMQG